MAASAQSTFRAAQARRSYVEGLLQGLPSVVQAIVMASRILLGQVAEPALLMRRRAIDEDLQTAAGPWLGAMSSMLRDATTTGVVAAVARGGAEMPRSSGRPGGGGAGALSLVENDVIEGEILSSRLALSMMDRASWEFTDLRSRMNLLEARDELDANDVLRPHVLARVVTTSWAAAGLRHTGWRTLQAVIHDEFAHFAEEAYHEANRWLIAQQVMPEIDLRPFIRRTRSAGLPGGAAVAGPTGPAAFAASASVPMPSDRMPPGGPSSAFAPARGAAFKASAALSGSAFGSPLDSVRHRVGEEARGMSRVDESIGRGQDHAEAVLGRLNRLINRQLPEFAVTAQAGHTRPASPALRVAIAEVQQGIAGQLPDEGGSAAERAPVDTPRLLEELSQRKRVLKDAAATPGERATIEIVALLFQSLLAEERIPATVRVWFARLQMPVLRVAVGEPDFFATTDHPARRLIDRMGACVMGFDSNAHTAAEIVEREIKRVVQVVEAYPDTGRRVFQTVLTEFEKFLEHYFRNDNEASRKGVSLAQQVEQRETLAIQYTIELRKMLNEVPVQEGVREFLFHVWADVLAMTAVKDGLNSDATRGMKRAAADLIWSASAKVSRDERAEVIRRLPPLLKTLRDGMHNAGLPTARQDEHIQQLNNSLAAAFTARAAAIPHDRLEHLMARLETLEEMLPDADDVEIDESMVLDLSGHESSELEVVAEGGSMPTPAMLSWARELQVGSWYMLDYRNRNESVQLAWQGLRRQLTLFVSPAGRGVLFQQQRLAAFLQAGLLVPAQDESLTVRATRSAMEKLDADPNRLLN